METFFQTYCCFGGEEDCKEGILAAVESAESEEDVAKLSREYKQTSMKIEKLEECIVLHARQREQRRRRFTVLAKEIDMEETDPEVHPKTDVERQFLETVLHTYAGCEAAGAECGKKFNNKLCERNYFIFSDLTETERKLMVDIMVKDLSFKAGDWIYQRGVVGEYFFIVDQGTVELELPPPEVAERMSNGSSASIFSDMDGPPTIITRELGQSFGEIALLFDEPRNHGARAKTDCILWKVHQKAFRSKLAQNSLGHEAKMMDLLKSIPLFARIAVDTSLLRKFANSLEEVVFSHGERIVNKGDAGNVFYIVEKGKVKVHDIGMGDSQTRDQVLSEGGWFGERALLTGDRRAANVTALTPTVTTLAVDRETFQATFGSFEGCLEHHMKNRFLKAIPIFADSNISHSEFDQLAAKMEKLSYRKGQMLDEVGKSNRQEVFVVQHGKIVIYDGAETDGGKVFTLKNGSYFGDKHIHENPPRLSTRNVVVEENATCWSLSRAAIEEVIGSVDRLGQPMEFRRKRRVSQIRAGIFLNNLDMEKRRLLGQGGFGKVWLVQHKSTGVPYALKAINKRQLVKTNQVKSVLREKEILSTAKHPFILEQVSTFQDENHLYILLDLIQGGELYTRIESRNGTGLGLEEARFYAACIIDALRHFHQRSIAYRDLKTENIMIAKDGYCIIVDLGFAKVITSKSFTLLGTPEYLAPEILMSKGHDKAVDYWTFGVLLYEMLTGVSPFYLRKQKKVDMFKRIVTVDYGLPPSMDEHAADLISKLLIRNPTSRLGNLSNGPADIQNHPFFQSVDWKKLLKKELEAPWIPTIKEGAAVDESQFDPMGHGKVSFGPALSKSEQSIFKDF